jgi:hypothetical protein
MSWKRVRLFRLFITDIKPDIDDVLWPLGGGPIW